MMRGDIGASSVRGGPRMKMRGRPHMGVAFAIFVWCMMDHDV